MSAAGHLNTGGAVSAGVINWQSGANKTTTIDHTLTASSEITLAADTLALNTVLTAPEITLKPFTANRSIGIGAASVGLFKFLQADLANLSTSRLNIGGADTTGNIDVDQLDLTGVAMNLGLLTTGGTITDASAGEAANIIMDPNSNLTLGAGTGTGQIGAPGNADLDINVSGTGLLNVKTNGANAYINLTNDTLLDLVDVGSGFLSLSSDGSIFDGNGSAYNLIIGNNSELYAAGTIGTASDGLEVKPGGSFNVLNVTANSQVNGVSAQLVVDTLPNVTINHSGPGNFSTVFLQQFPAPPPPETESFVSPPFLMNPLQTPNTVAPQRLYQEQATIRDLLYQPSTPSSPVESGQAMTDGSPADDLPNLEMQPDIPIWDDEERLKSAR